MGFKHRKKLARDFYNKINYFGLGLNYIKTEFHKIWPSHSARRAPNVTVIKNFVTLKIGQIAKSWKKCKNGFQKITSNTKCAYLRIMWMVWGKNMYILPQILQNNLSGDIDGKYSKFVSKSNTFISKIIVLFIINLIYKMLCIIFRHPFVQQDMDLN